MKSTVIVDTNVIVRFFLDDHPRLSPRAKNLFKSAELGNIAVFIDEVTIAEVVWVLRSFYKSEKQHVISYLEKMVSQKWAINPRKKLILAALSDYAQNNLAYIDCWVSQVAKHYNYQLKTFDKNLVKFHAG